LNIACILLFADFNLGFANNSLGIPILIGKYRDFDKNWYYDDGAKITMAMVSNSIAPWASKLADPLVASILRYLDRGFKKHLKKKTNLREEAAEKAKLQKKVVKV
jgi:hypothetical protein